ncbi:hypothetical protein [Serratia marcescens]|uniref:hypothetical protein n=1 Tax=Serratia marcescens TaxID=615 RepID=UPI001F14BB65|nr:hypothetical protein [Serratia marcescens]
MKSFADIDMAQRGILGFLKQELSIFPGRYNAMLRYMLSSTIVIVISMALSVPQLAYSLLMVFFATQQNIVLTRMVFPMLMLVNAMSVLCGIVLLKFTIDYPMLRLILAAVMLIVLLYLMRSSQKWGILFFVVAVMIVYTQSFVDVTSNGEMLLRNLMWTLVAGGYAIVVAFIVNTIVLPVEPARQLKMEVERVLNIISSMLNSAASGKPVNKIEFGEVQRSVLTLHKYLKFSIMRDIKFRENKELYLAQIGTIERIYFATCNLHNLTSMKLSPVVVEHCHKLSQKCQLLLQSIIKDQKYSLILQDKEREEIMALPDCLREMYSSLLSLSLQIFHDEHKIASEKKDDSREVGGVKGLSYRYIKYGIKVLLSVAICYVFYTSVQWPGIHTSMGFVE